MDKLRKFLNGDDSTPDEESGIMSQVNISTLCSYCPGRQLEAQNCGPTFDATTLSWSTRIKGFLICFIVGILLSFLGSFALFLKKGLTLFAIFYTLGNVLSMLSTCFLMGPCNQLKRMFAETRAIATVLVIASLVMTLLAALWLHNPFLALLFIIIQALAMTWYSLSYIPYARDAVKKTLSSCVV